MMECGSFRMSMNRLEEQKPEPPAGEPAALLPGPRTHCEIRLPEFQDSLRRPLKSAEAIPGRGARLRQSTEQPEAGPAAVS